MSKEKSKPVVARDKVYSKRRISESEIASWKLTGLLANCMNFLDRAYFHADTYGSKIIFVFKDKPSEDASPISPNLHNRFLSKFRDVYKNTVLLDYDNLPDLLKRRESYAKMKARKDAREAEKFKKKMESHTKVKS